MEVVVVIIIMGILAGVVMIGGSPLESSRRVNADALKSAIRYAQSRAMKTGNPWGITWNSSSYWLFVQEGTSSTPKPIPGEEALVVNLAVRSMGLTSSMGSILSFDLAGRPCSDASATTPLTADQTMTIAATSGSPSETITITRETGYLQ